MPDYSDRRVTSASIYGLELARSAEGPSVHGSVRIQLSNYAGEDDGPLITIDFGAPVLDGATIQDAEAALLDAALGVLGRTQSATVEELKALLPSSFRLPKPI